MRRVVVTGMGALSPLGRGVRHNWERLVREESGIRRIEGFSTDGLASKIAGIIPRGSGAGELDLDALFSAKEARRNDEFILYALCATEEAIQQAGFRPDREEERARTGVVMGSAIGGFQTISKGSLDFARGRKEALTPFFITSQLINLASGQIALRYGFYGPDFSIVSACATGAEAIAAGARSILLDEADVMVVGGVDAAIHPLAIAGFEKIHTLSTAYNDRPTEASRPFDRGRDGFVIAEGAGALVLEELGHARRRGAELLAELRGFASASDGYHIAASHPEGLGEQRAMRLALARAGLGASEVDYVNAHATGTQVGDGGELTAIRSVFGADGRLAVSSTKSATGHTFGAAGALEAIYAICAIREGAVPPTLNLAEVDEGFESLNLVAGRTQERPVHAALSNSFGFGATKVALVFAEARGERD